MIKWNIIGNSFGHGLRVDRAVKFVWQATPGWTLVSSALLIVQSIIPLVTLYIAKLIVDRLTELSGNVSQVGSYDWVYILIFIALGITVIGNLCNAVLGYANLNQAHLVADHMQHMVQAKSIDMDLAYYENSQYYDKLHRAQREAPSRPLRIVQGLTEVGRNGLTLLGAFIILLSFHWAVVFAVGVASVPIVIYRIRHAEAVYALHREKTALERMCQYLNHVITTADNAKEVRVFGFGSALANRFSDLRRKIRTSLQKISAIGYRRQFITESAAALAVFGSLAFIANSAVNKSITLGELVMYFGAFQIALGALRPTLGAIAELYENNLFLSTLYEFLELPKKIAEPKKPKKLSRSWREGLVVKNLSFRYPDTDKLVLDGIEMVIRPGEIVALVGRNGSGKTTLTKLLTRLYDPDIGNITIEGTDLREYSTKDLRQAISVIYQDFGRYHMTARENIWLGCPEISVDNPAISESANWAGIHDDLMQLRQGYDTVLGRTFMDGAELSIGQWQKLALARAFVRKAQLILLDEPTSSLDAASEFEFFEKFREMARDRAALIISHRFSTVRLADRIYVLEKGKMIEEGNHKELLQVNGLYAHLYQQQASYYQTHQSIRTDKMFVPSDMNVFEK